VQTLRVERWSDLPDAVAALGFTRPVPTLVVVGAAAGLADDDSDRLQPLFDRMAALAERLGTVVVDGGTDTGVMRLLGRGRARGHDFPLVGVAVATLVVRAGAESSDGQWPLEPNHSHVLLVPGTEWGDEARWLARAATLIAGGAPSVTVLVNGGRVARTDAEMSLSEGRAVIAAAGSGGTADDVASGRARVPGPTDLVNAVDVREDAGQSLFAEIERILSDGSQPWTQ
jgi:hypothetical protein